jgi:hypothetical protein
VKTQFASRVILFQKTLKYYNVILIYYGQQQTIHLFSKVLVFRTRVIGQTTTDTFFLVVKLCVLDQSASY